MRNLNGFTGRWPLMAMASDLLGPNSVPCWCDDGHSPEEECPARSHWLDIEDSEFD